MVVDHDDRQANGFGFIEGINGGAAAVDSDDELGAGILQVAKGSWRWPIALFQTVRHVEAEILPPAAEVAGQDR